MMIAIKVLRALLESVPIYKIRTYQALGPKGTAVHINFPSLLIETLHRLVPSEPLTSGAPNDNFWKISVRKMI